MYEIRITDDTLTGLKQQLATLVENLGARETNEEEQPDTSCFAPLPEMVEQAQIPTERDLSQPVMGTTEIDKDGLPWDERIHSSNKQLTQEGFWRKRRGVTEDLVKGVESELRGVETKEVPPPPVAEPDNPMGPFIAFVGRVMAAIGEKTLTQQQVDGVCTKHGVSSMAALGQRPDLVAVIEKELFP